MKVQKNKVVEIHYTLRDETGQVIDTTEGEPPLPYLHGASNIVPGLEQALEGRSVGDRFTATVAPDQGYGNYDEQLVEEIPLDAFPEDFELAEGEMIITADDAGNEAEGFIEEISDDTVIINYNHPLAGRTLSFEVEVADVRDATAEELEHGHAHDPYADEDDEDDWEDWDEDDWEDDEDEDEDWDEDDK